MWDLRHYLNADIQFVRMECSEAGVHAPSVAGISFSTDAKKRDANPGAYSIVLNGGYEDDRDAGYVM